MRFGLLATQGPKRGIYIEFPEGKAFWIGRSKTANFILKEENKVSGKHCCFLRQGRKLEVRDESRNGTKLNGYLLHNARSALKNSDILCIGSSHFQVVDMEGSSFQAENLADEENEIKEILIAIQKRKDSQEEVEIPEVIGPYLPIEIIGVGAFSKVYKALHKTEKKIVALKVFSNLDEINADFIGRFLREAELLKKLIHPSIIKLYDTGGYQANHKLLSYLALEYFQGVDLRDHILSHGKMPWQRVVQILSQIAKGLQYMHSLGILHRDLKPGNIIYNDIKGIAKIIDLGLGKCVLEEERETFCITAPNSSMGTPNFMSLEQWQDSKEVNERADIYSLGATAYYLLTATIPYENHSGLMNMYHAVIQQKLIPLEKLLSSEQIPTKLIEMIQTMMAVDEEDRYSSCEQIIKELEALST